MNVVAPRAGLGLVLSLHSRLRCIRFASALQHVDAKIQIYKSSSRDPFLNLSIEHHLFKHAAPGTTLLLFYTNRPCIVIGRNQNPWLEVNHRMLKSGAVKGLESIDLVRRRSGGGAVFHDEGNANWSVMCDLPDFTRDKHAEMVVRGLRRIGVDRARVNERHDVVLDVGQKESSVDPEDTHATPYTVVNDPRGQLKVTGSAYKMAKGRALHHGTALLSSPHVAAISKLLNSPAKGHLDAKGIGSVSSPVTNLGLTESQFHDAVLAEFRAMYNGGAEGGLVEKEVGEECLQNSSVREGYEELKVGRPESTRPAPRQPWLMVRSRATGSSARPRSSALPFRRRTRHRQIPMYVQGS